jgi:hypothetical protein
MNIAMENCEESFGDKTMHSYKSIFIRGNNGNYIPKITIYILLNILVLYITLI